MQQKSAFALVLVLGLSQLGGCAVSQPATDRDAASRQADARNTRTYCRNDIDRTGQNDVATAVNRSASSARSRC